MFMTDLELLQERLAALDERIEGLLALEPEKDFFGLDEVRVSFQAYDEMRKELRLAGAKFADLSPSSVPEPAVAAPLPNGVERRHVERLLLDIRHAIRLIGDLSDDYPGAEFVRYR
jgi:hypothetical protein